MTRRLDASGCTTCDCDHDGTGQGFATNPGCGLEADCIHCKDSLILGLACTEDVPKREKRTQGCR